MDFIHLTDSTQLDEIVKDSFNLETGVLIFKHSTRCAISSMALNRFRNRWNYTGDSIALYYLDLIAYRKLSNEIAQRFGVMHESPQVLLVKNGECVYDASHNAISPDEIQDLVNG